MQEQEQQLLQHTPDPALHACRRHRRPPAPAALSRLAARSADLETPCVLMATARAWERREGRSGAQAAAGPRVLQNLAASVTRRHRRSEGGQEENVTRWDGRQGVEVSRLHSPTSMVPTVTLTALSCRQLPSQHPLLLWSSHRFESSDASIVTVLNMEMIAVGRRCTCMHATEAAGICRPIHLARARAGRQPMGTHACGPACQLGNPCTLQGCDGVSHQRETQQRAVL